MLVPPPRCLILIHAFGSIYLLKFSCLNGSVNTTFSSPTSSGVFNVSPHSQTLKGAFEHFNSHIVKQCF